MDQKFQLFEQIATVINPGFDIQNSDNTLDWTALTTMTIEDMVWSTITIPVGVESEIDVLTFTLKLPFWITPPAMVTKQTIIQQIIANMWDANGIDLHDGTIREFGGAAAGASLIETIVITPGDMHVMVNGGNITLLGPDASINDPNGNPYNWSTYLAQYGALAPSVSTLRLQTNLMQTTTDVVGTIQLDPINVNNLFWTINTNTLPANTLSPITGIIDPLSVSPGINLPAATIGQSYLLLHDIGSIGNSTVAWGNLVSHQNDIITFNGASWAVSFEASINTTTVAYVLNQASGKQLHWTGTMWIIAIDGEYNPGYWRIVL
jgi:hypothetical protein